MLCDKCKKNTATVFYKQVINGEVTEMNLCADCANSMGTKMSMSFDNIFQGFLDGFLGNEVPNKSNSHVFKCPSCSTTFEDFRNTGRFGCVDCYNTFREQILPLLKNVHGSNIHTGKLPQKSGEEFLLKRKLEDLKLSLRKAIENEEYEEAAHIRDEIRELEGGGQK